MSGVINGAIECVFLDGGKKKTKSRKPRGKSSKVPTKRSDTSSYCYKCASMTLDKNAVFNGNTRDSNCSKCSSKRSVFST
jgi:hypothetical protein